MEKLQGVNLYIKNLEASDASPRARRRAARTPHTRGAAAPKRPPAASAESVALLLPPHRLRRTLSTRTSSATSSRSTARSPAPTSSATAPRACTRASASSPSPRAASRPLPLPSPRLSRQPLFRARPLWRCRRLWSHLNLTPSHANPPAPLPRRPEEATKAVTETNGKMVNGKPIYVALAQRKEDRAARFQQHFARAPQMANMAGMSPFMGAGMGQGPMFYGQPPPGLPQMPPGGPGGYGYQPVLPPGRSGQVMPQYMMPGTGMQGDRKSVV